MSPSLGIWVEQGLNDPIVGINESGRTGSTCTCLRKFSEHNGYVLVDFFSELRDPKHFTGINFSNFHANVQIRAPQRMCTVSCTKIANLFCCYGISIVGITSFMNGRKYLV